MPKKTVTKQQKATKTNDAASLRQLKRPEHKSFRLSKKVKLPPAPMLGSFRLFKKSFLTLTKDWRLFGGIILIYLILTIGLVKGLGISGNIGDLKESLQSLFAGRFGEILSGLTLFGVLVGGTSSPSTDVSGAYQALLLIIMSLVFIWALRNRQTDTTKSIGIRDPFYKGLFPFIPFVLVLLVIGLQLLPLITASFLYNVVFGTGLAVTAIEKMLWMLLFTLLVLLTFYMVTSSIFALYIVSLPDIRPMQALRSARELVRHRRWVIMRKVLFLPVALIVIGSFIIVPIIIVATPLAEWLFFILSISAVAMVHSYMYGLYRELLKR